MVMRIIARPSWSGKEMGLAGYLVVETLPDVLDIHREAGDALWCLQVSGSSEATGSRNQCQDDLIASPETSILAYRPEAEKHGPVFMLPGAPGGMTVRLETASARV
jgi:hypothetical protein